MTYFKPETCQLLEKLGLNNEVKYWWHIPPIGSKWEGKPKLTSTDRVHFTNEESVLPAFTPADIILSAENAKKLWGEEKVCPCCGGKVKYTRHDDYLSGEIEMIGECESCYFQPIEDYLETVPGYVFESEHLLGLIHANIDIEPLIAEAAKKRLLYDKK